MPSEIREAWSATREVVTHATTTPTMQGNQQRGSAYLIEDIIGHINSFLTPSEAAANRLVAFKWCTGISYAAYFEPMVKKMCEWPQREHWNARVELKVMELENIAVEKQEQREFEEARQNTTLPSLPKCFCGCDASWWNDIEKGKRCTKWKAKRSQYILGWGSCVLIYAFAAAFGNGLRDALPTALVLFSTFTICIGILSLLLGGHIGPDAEDDEDVVNISHEVIRRCHFRYCVWSVLLDVVASSMMFGGFLNFEDATSSLLSTWSILLVGGGCLGFFNLVLGRFVAYNFFFVIATNEPPQNKKSKENINPAIVALKEKVQMLAEAADDSTGVTVAQYLQSRFERG